MHAQEFLSTFVLLLRTKQVKKMELTEFITKTDREIVAAKHGVSEDYVWRVQTGKRNQESETGQQIMTDLEFLALQNMTLGVYKCDALGVKPETIYHN